jgi:hypothetical protein
MIFNNKYIKKNMLLILIQMKYIWPLFVKFGAEQHGKEGIL